MKVIEIKYEECENWLLNIHYAKRMPMISHSFGLYKDKILKGIITYGLPPSPDLCKGICGEQYKDKVLELNRLVLEDNIKNYASYFIAKTLKLLQKPKIIVSFADPNQNHCGYIYQASNFIYTGTSLNSHMFIDKDGNEFHFRNLGHYQENNKLNVALIKKRKNEKDIDKVEIAKYLKSYKGNYTAKQLDKIFGYKDTASHWFRLDSGFSFPSIKDWNKLKELLNFDDKYDRIMNDFEYVPDIKEIIKKLHLTKKEILPKHRYIYLLGSKTQKKQMLKYLKYEKQKYPKGKNINYEITNKPVTQQILF